MFHASSTISNKKNKPRPSVQLVLLPAVLSCVHGLQLVKQLCNILLNAGIPADRIQYYTDCQERNQELCNQAFMILLIIIIVRECLIVLIFTTAMFSDKERKMKTQNIDQMILNYSYTLNCL